MTDVFISLGSNLGDPLAQLRQAVQAIKALPQTRVLALSGAWRSAAVGPGTQPDYLNAVLKLTTSLTPHALLDALQEIEHQQGRERAIRWEARTLDLDILLFGDQTIADQRLLIPHPRMTQRDFVLYPLLEVAGASMTVPGQAVLADLIERCPRGKLSRTEFALDTDGALPLASGQNRP